MNTPKHTLPPHPVLDTAPEWEVTNFPTTIELRHKLTKVVACFPKPYNPQPLEWWKEQARAAIAKAEGRQ